MSAKTPPDKPHDHGHRQLFNHARMVEDLLRGFVDAPLIDELDFSTLEPCSNDFIVHNLGGERRSDCIWKIRWRGQDLYIFILLEFQATSDWLMPVRMMTYVGLFYEKLVKTESRTESDKLPPVLPIVLYNGDARWRAQLNVRDLIEVPEDSWLTDYCPRMRYFIVDEQHLDLGPLSGMENVVAAVFELWQGPEPKASTQLMRQMAEWLNAPKHEALRRDLAMWIGQVYLPLRGMTSQIPRVGDLQELLVAVENTMQTWTEQLTNRGIQQGIQQGIQTGVQKGRQEGIEEGRKKGEAMIFVRLLEQKLGPLDEATLARIDAASADQLLVWADRLLSARSLDDVFEGPQAT